MKLRPATLADSAFLYAVRNDPEVRRWSRNTEAFSEAQHEIWFADTLHNPRVRILVAQYPDPVGFAKLVLEGIDVASASIALRPDRRRMGIGSLLLRCLVDEAIRLGWNLRAYIRHANEVSYHLFVRAGFQYLSDDDAFVHLIRRTTPRDAPRICDGCRAGWPHRRHPLGRISSRWASEAERDADMATWPVLYDLHEEPVGEGQVLVHECTAAKLFDRSLA